jgi:hypothetical protein
MKYISLLIIIAFFASCSTMPAITEPMIPATQKKLTCPSPYLKGKYQLTHAIEINAAGNAQGAIIGITVVDPPARFVSCAIMIAEGMVLLEAQLSGESLIVHRALPPFDSGDFAKNLIDDIKLIYFAPEGLMLKKGNLDDGSTACRWQEENGNFIDVVAHKTEITEIKKYSECGSLKRHIKLMQVSGNPYSSIEVKGSGIVDYTLLMTLIDAQPAIGKLSEKEKVKVKNNEKSSRR